MFRNASGSVRRNVLYNILVEFGVPNELVSVIKMCMHEMSSGVRTENIYLMLFQFLTE
jgi:hypothetical protein